MLVRYKAVKKLTGMLKGLLEDSVGDMEADTAWVKRILRNIGKCKRYANKVSVPFPVV